MAPASQAARTSSTHPFAATPTMHTQTKNPISYAGRDLYAPNESFERNFNFANAQGSLLPQYHHTSYTNDTNTMSQNAANSLPFHSQMLSDARFAEQYRLSLMGNEQNRLDQMMRQNVHGANFASNFGNPYFDKQHQQFPMGQIPGHMMNLANLQHLQGYPFGQHALFAKDKSSHASHLMNSAGLNVIPQMPPGFSQQNHANSPPVNAAAASYK